MRHVALLWIVAVCAGATLPPRAAHAACDQPPCVDAEPMWLPPAATRFTLISDATAPDAGQLAASLTFALRWRPAALTVPAPSQDGRDVNLLAYAVDAALGARLGLGQRLELTMVAPVGLYQRGSGIKGITDQRAEELPAQSLHDPRLSFGYAFDTGSARFGAKLRFEAKVPLGNADGLAGEASPVASPSVVFNARLGHLTAGLELGARLRRPVDFYGSYIGSQALVAAALDYSLTRPRLSFTFEEYLLPSLVRRGASRYFPAEWLLSTRLAPEAWRGLSVGLAGGGGFPFSSTPTGQALALGVPAFRGLVFVRFAPAS